MTTTMPPLFRLLTSEGEAAPASKAPRPDVRILFVDHEERVLRSGQRLSSHPDSEFGISEQLTQRVLNLLLSTKNLIREANHLPRDCRERARQADSCQIERRDRFNLTVDLSIRKEIAGGDVVEAPTCEVERRLRLAVSNETWASGTGGFSILALAMVADPSDSC